MSNIKETIEWWEEEKKDLSTNIWGEKRYNVNGEVLDALKEAIKVIQYIKDYEGDNQDVWFDELQAKADQWIKEWM